MNANLKRLLTLSTILCISLLVTSCFHLRRPSDFPKPLRTLYFTSDNVNSAITSELKRQLKASKVHFSSSSSYAPLTLKLYNSRTDTNIPIAFDSTAASYYYYKISVNVKLSTKNNQTIFDTPIAVSENIIYNVNQVGTPVITLLMRRTLTRRLVNTIYDQLISGLVLKHIKILAQKNKKT